MCPGVEPRCSIGESSSEGPQVMSNPWISRILAAIYGMALGWFVGLIRLICQIRKDLLHQKDLRGAGNDYTRCQVIPPDVYKRPDPLIYCQSYLMSLGLAVTWDNPDIQIYEIGPSGARTPVSSNDLQVSTTYEVWATIYNGSTTAPAIGMPVEFSYLSFGIGTVSHAIGTTNVDLQVKGAPGVPATAKMLWTTPPTVGHYCLQVKLVWADDANPDNNLGQENTNVGAAHSPAVFEFPVRNANVVRTTLTLVADSYVLPEQLDCDKVINDRFRDDNVAWDDLTEEQRQKLIQRWCRELAARHDRGDFPVPAGWSVDIQPNNFDLDPDATQLVKVTVAPPDTFHGTQAVNINAFDAGKHFLGGVTLYTTR